MDNDFLDKLFLVLQIPEQSAIGFRKDFEEIISYNVTTALLNNLPDDKKETFAALAKNGNLDKESMAKWIEEQNLKDDKGLVEKLNAAIEKSYNDFLDALTQDLDENKKVEVGNFARSYLNG